MPIQASIQVHPQSEPEQTFATTTASGKSARIPALDFTKGTLVLLMVLYHWANYFLEPPAKFYDYLRFLTPSFIFITGFMVSNVYLSKYAAADPRLSKRLFTRGLKLMAVFLALNLARNLVAPIFGTGVPARNLPTPASIFAVFVSGDFPVTGGKLISFSILVPISYLLMMCGMLMLAYNRHKYIFHFVCVLLLFFVLGLAILGTRVYNVEFIAIGLLGVLTGFLPVRRINDMGSHPYLLALIYLSYLLAITIWNVPFPLLILGVFLTLTVIYLIGASGDQRSSVTREIILLGKYSLFGYISQIAILQILNAAFRRWDGGLAALTISFVAAFALTVVSVEIMDRARALNARVDRMYKVVFA
jgi:peptidoglycan/LPS O-acetylase OafA/YrhL